MANLFDSNYPPGVTGMEKEINPPPPKKKRRTGGDPKCPNCKGIGREPGSDTTNWLPCRECGGPGL